jgi:hypothetical protein
MPRNQKFVCVCTQKFQQFIQQIAGKQMISGAHHTHIKHERGLLEMMIMETHFSCSEAMTRDNNTA